MITITKHGDVQRSNPLRIVVWGTAAFALLLPWFAMQFTSEVDWDFADFAIFGTMLLVVCGSYELGTRLTGNKAYRLAVGVALLGAFLLTWINLAVGIIGNEENSANLMFFAIPVVGMVGALIVRFESRGMASALVATAIAQALVAVIALIAGWGHTIVLTGFFVILWLTSAQLFRNAAQEQSSESQAS
jgi:hypothetical protein